MLMIILINITLLAYRIIAFPAVCRGLCSIIRALIPVIVRTWLYIPDRQILAL